MPSIDWGDVPTWMGALFAAGAAFGALGALRSQRTQLNEQRQFIAEQRVVLDLQRQELEDTLAERRVGPLRRHIKMWYQLLNQDGEPSTAGHPDEQVRWRVRIGNRWDSPIREVSVFFGIAEAVETTMTTHNRDTEEWVELPPDPCVEGRTIKRLGPNKTAVFYSAWGVRGELIHERPTCRFRDVERAAWVLDEDNDIMPFA
ncbi:hypothetical protein ACFCYH_42280 [Streptomyces sp. NPDC056400]|uniref:hypothetical protein n=1 Tax=Streptomyces sp. NPDC056400 TaxID=3345808 RepID=UPI0035D84713